MNLDTIIDLFTDKHTCDLADRHAQSIIALCEQMDNELNTQGFYFSDLDKVAQILELLFNGLQDRRVSFKICNCFSLNCLLRFRAS
jgi:hypothetical protein